MPELFNLKWKNVDFKHKKLYVVETEEMIEAHLAPYHLVSAISRLGYGKNRAKIWQRARNKNILLKTEDSVRLYITIH